MASGPITSWEIDGETVETVSDFLFWGAPKSLQIVIAAIKRNKFESAVVRSMKLEPVEQSEVSQKEKNKYCILMHLHGI